MKFDSKFLEEIRRFETIYCLISGGYHSTTSALLLKDHGFEKVILIHNKTHLESKSCQNTMKKAKAYLGTDKITYPCKVKENDLWNGWARPYFEKEEIYKIINNLDLEIVKETEDQIMLRNDLSEAGDYEIAYRTEDGWQLGAGSWIWDLKSYPFKKHARETITGDYEIININNEKLGKITMLELASHTLNKDPKEITEDDLYEFEDLSDEKRQQDAIKLFETKKEKLN